MRDTDQVVIVNFAVIKITASDRRTFLVKHDFFKIVKEQHYIL